VLALALTCFAAQQTRGNGAPRAAATPDEERLVYRVQWDPPWYLFFIPKVDAGEVALEYSGEVEYEGRKASRMSLKALSSGSLAKISGMKIEDELNFYTEPGTYCTLSASEKIREGKRKRQIDVQYFRDPGRLHIREVDESTVPPKVRKDETKNNIPECVHDPLSALFMFRQLPLRSQFSQTFVLANDDKIREVRGRVEKKDTVDLASGKIDAWQISTAALMGGLFKEGGQFKVWLSADDKKVPVQFEARVRLGRVLGKLKSD
jgi:hypothetical protein